MTEDRRKRILDILTNKEEPVTGSDLAKIFNVSRQVIVQDIAVLRAQGINIISTSNGYLIPAYDNQKRNIKTIVCRHQGYQDIEEELKTIIDVGGKILDVIVVHPIYGEIRCSLMIKSRHDLEKFLNTVKREKAEPLSSLTGGEHIHTIEVPNDEAYDIILSRLEEKGFLVND